MTKALNGALLFLLCMFIAAPTLVILVSSFSESELIQFPPESYSIKWYINALSRPEFRTAAWNSVWVAALSTLIALVIALGASLALVRSNLPGRGAIQTLLLAPLVVPSIVIGLSILLASTRLGLQFPGPRLLRTAVQS